MYSNGRLLLLYIQLRQTSNSVTRSPETPYSGEPITLYLFATESSRSGPRCPCIPVANLTQLLRLVTTHIDRHPQPVHEARLRLRAKRAVCNNSLLWKPFLSRCSCCPVIGRQPNPIKINEPAPKGQEPPLVQATPCYCFMASHWPPINFPVRKMMRLAAGCTIVWVRHLSGQSIDALIGMWMPEAQH